MLGYNVRLFCSYILFVPFETEDNSESGIVYVWIGSKTTAEETRVIEEIAEDMFNNPWVSLQVRIKLVRRYCIRRKKSINVMYGVVH